MKNLFFFLVFRDGYKYRPSHRRVIPTSCFFSHLLSPKSLKWSRRHRRDASEKKTEPWKSKSKSKKQNKLMRQNNTEETAVKQNRLPEFNLLRSGASSQPHSERKPWPCQHRTPICGDKPVKFRVFCPHNGTAVLKGWSFYSVIPRQRCKTRAA